MLDKVGYAVSPTGRAPIFYRLCTPDGVESTKEAVVLCDGIGCDGFIWKYIEPLLVKDRPVLHWHYRGHGRSPSPKDPSQVGIEVLSDDLAAVLDDAGLETADIVGHSMGVQVALEFHRRHRHRSKALVLICGAASEPLKTFKGTALLDVVLPTVRAAIGTAPGFFSSMSRALLPRDWIYKLATRLELEEDLLSQQDFMPYLKGLAQIDPTLFFSMLASAAQHSAQDFLEQIRVPTLIVAGEHDTFTPPDLSREMAQKIPSAELLVIHGGSHTAPLEHPHLVGAATIDFLNRAPTQPLL